jgi:RNA polymerase sigma factor (sigma-70 family)
MTTQPLSVALHFLHRSLDSGTAGRSDGDLLAWFTAECDPAAFEELVRRYEAMVMNVCRRQLGQGADADDAFQATFFILARKARSIRKRDSVGSWLHGVAHRLSRQVLGKRATRLRCEEKMRQSAQNTPTREDPVHLASLRELGVILDDELRNLPAVCRAALVACHLEGLSTTEAAHRLGVPASTLKSRLQRGRELLRQRLQRRGVGLTLAALTAVLAGQNRSGAAPAFVRVTVQAALCVATSRPAAGATRAASLMTQALGAGVPGRVSLAAGAVLAFALVGLGAAFCTSPRTGTDPNGHGFPGQDVALAPDQQKQVRLDRLGDPLPPGAIQRLGTTRWRQPSGVTGIGFTTDGKQVATVGNQALYLWETTTGREVRRLDSTNVIELAISPAGGMMASAQNDHVQVWDLSTGKPRFRRNTPGFAVAISKDGGVLATGGRTRGGADPVVLWDLKTGDKLRSLTADMVQICRLAFSPDGKSLAASARSNGGFPPPKGSRAEVVRFWEVDTGRLHELEGHTGEVTSLAFSPDSKVLATGGHDGTLLLWDTATRKRLHKTKIVEEAYSHRKGKSDRRGGILALAFAPEGMTIASANYDSTVRLFEAATGKPIRVLRGHARSVTDVAYSPDGKILATGSEDQTVRLWDAATGELQDPRPGHDGGATSVLVSSDARRAVTAGHDRTVRIWDLATGQEVLVLREFKSAVESVALSSGGDLLAVGLEDGAIQLRDAVSGAMRRELKGHSGMVRSLSFSPDGKTLASTAPSGVRSNLVQKETVRSLRMWDVGTGHELPRIHGNRNDWYARFSPDGKWLAAYENGVVLWDPAAGKQLRRLDGLSDFAFLPDGKRIAGWSPAPLARGVGGGGLGAEKGKVRVRNLADGGEDYDFEGPARVNVIGGLFVLSPDGRLLALPVNEDRGFEHKSLQLWEMATGKLRRTLRGHGGQLTGCAFSPDGRVVLTTSSDTTALVWDLGLPPEPRPKVLSDQALESLWGDLGDADAGRGDAAIWALVAAPQQAPALLKKKVRPTPASPPGWRAWVKDLGSEQFAVRDKATREVEALGERAYPLLKQELAGTPTLEVRRRIEILLGKLAYPLKSPSTIRELRAVEVLEHIGAEQAGQVLQALAQGEASSRLTEEAKASLERLAKRKAP